MKSYMEIEDDLSDLLISFHLYIQYMSPAKLITSKKVIHKLLFLLMCRSDGLSIVIYIHKQVVLSWKWCKIDTLLQTTKRK